MDTSTVYQIFNDTVRQSLSSRVGVMADSLMAQGHSGVSAADLWSAFYSLTDRALLECEPADFPKKHREAAKRGTMDALRQVFGDVVAELRRRGFTVVGNIHTEIEARND